MAADWTRLARGQNVAILEDEVAEVRLLGDRGHRVRILDEGGSFLFVAVVARQAATAALPNASLFAWERNRSSRLVGFRVDDRDRLIGEAWLPKDGVTPAEFQLYLRTVAAECDRLEHLVSGRDVE